MSLISDVYIKNNDGSYTLCVKPVVATYITDKKETKKIVITHINDNTQTPINMTFRTPLISAIWTALHGDGNLSRTGEITNVPPFNRFTVSAAEIKIDVALSEFCLKNAKINIDDDTKLLLDFIEKISEQIKVCYWENFVSEEERKSELSFFDNLSEEIALKRAIYRYFLPKLNVRPPFSLPNKKTKKDGVRYVTFSIPIYRSLEKKKIEDPKLIESALKLVNELKLGDDTRFCRFKESIPVKDLRLYTPMKFAIPNKENPHLMEIVTFPQETITNIPELSFLNISKTPEFVKSGDLISFQFKFEHFSNKGGMGVRLVICNAVEKKFDAPQSTIDTTNNHASLPFTFNTKPPSEIHVSKQTFTDEELLKASEILKERKKKRKMEMLNVPYNSEENDDSHDYSSNNNDTKKHKIYTELHSKNEIENNPQKQN